MIEKWCDLNGTRICLRSAEDSLLMPVIEGWALRPIEPDGPADFTLTISCETVTPAPVAGPLLFDGLMPDKCHCVITQAGDKEFYLVEGRASLLLGERDGLLKVAPGAESLVRGSVAFQAVNAALALGSQYFLHAAALVLPRSEAAILIFGRSGFGKTTTTLALAAGGFGVLTDDASIVERGPEDDRVWGLPLALKVHQRSADMLPWLAPVLTDRWNSEGEQPLKTTALSALLDGAPPSLEPRPIAALIVIASRSDAGHCLRPITKSEALLAIADDNVARSLAGVTRHQQDRMRRIAELVTAHPTYEIRVGPKLDSLPRMLLQGLATP